MIFICCLTLVVLAYLSVSSLYHNTVDTYKMNCANVENLWVEVLKQSKKYIIGGVYRHPNSNVKEFTSKLDCVLSNVNRRKTPCVLAGDFNIDFSKIEVNIDTLNYVDIVLTNNFIPTVLMPTRITSKSCTLIDHMYFCAGGKPTVDTKILSSNFLQDISDHLADYIVICNTKSQVVIERPFVRIFSEKKTEIYKLLRKFEFQ